MLHDSVWGLVIGKSCLYLYKIMGCWEQSSDLSSIRAPRQKT